MCAAAPPSDHEAERYSRLMAVSQAMVSEEVLRAIPGGRFRRLMDVGGGSGAFLAAAARRWPRLTGVTVDLPPVAAAGGGAVREAGLGARLSAAGRNFLTDPLPEGADAASLIRVLYDHDDAAAAALLARVHAALPPQGWLVVAEPMSGGARPERAGDAYFGFYTMAMTSGAPRSAERLSVLLAEAGFVSIRRLPGGRPFVASVLLARRG